MPLSLSYTFHISNKGNAITTVDAVKKVSKHNLRSFQSKDYDKNQISIIAGDEKSILNDVKVIYHREFDDVLKKYNEGKIQSRRIDDYLDHISNSKTDVATEIIIQIGDSDFWKNKAITAIERSEIETLYRKQLENLEKLIPEFKTASAIIHFDESSPHLHVVGVPVSNGFKKGLEKQVSKTRIFTKESLSLLQDKMRENVKECIKELNVFKDLDVSEKQLGRNKDIPKNSLDEYYRLMDDKDFLEFEKNELQEENKALEIKKNQLGSEFKTVEKQLEQYVSALKVMNDKLKNINVKVSNKTEELNDVQEELNDAVKSLNLKENELNDLDIALNDKNANLSKLQANFDMLEIDVREKQQSISNLDEKISSKTEELNEIQNTLNDAVKSLNLKENELSDINIALDDKNAKLDKLQTNFDMLEVNIRKKQQSISKLEEEISSKQEELKKHKQQLEKIAVYEKNREKFEMINKAVEEKLEVKTFFTDRVPVKKSELMPLLALSNAFDERVKQLDAREKQLNLKENDINKQVENIIDDARHQAKSIIENASKKSLSLDDTVKLAKYERFVGDTELLRLESEEKSKNRSKNRNRNIEFERER